MRALGAVHELLDRRYPQHFLRVRTSVTVNGILDSIRSAGSRKGEDAPPIARRRNARALVPDAVRACYGWGDDGLDDGAVSNGPMHWKNWN